MTTKKGPVALNGNHRLTKDELLARMGEQRADFTLPGGGIITLRSFDLKTGFQFFGDSVENDAQARSDRTKKICLMGVADPELSVEDLELLDGANFGLVDKLATEILKLSGVMGDEAAGFLTRIPA